MRVAPKTWFVVFEAGEAVSLGRPVHPVLQLQLLGQLQLDFLLAQGIRGRGLLVLVLYLEDFQIFGTFSDFWKIFRLLEDFFEDFKIFGRC